MILKWIFWVQTVFELQNGLLLNAATKSSEGLELTPQEMTKKNFFFLKVNPKEMCSTTPVFCCVHSTPAINSDQQMVSKWHWFCKKTLHEGIWLKQANRQGKKNNRAFHTDKESPVQGEGKDGGEGSHGLKHIWQDEWKLFFWMKNTEEGRRMLREYFLRSLSRVDKSVSAKRLLESMTVPKWDVLVYFNTAPTITVCV